MSEDSKGLFVGKFDTSTMVVSEQVVDGFADVTGDHNPIHLDDEAAARTPFGKRIAHGMIGASLISAVIGNKMPGQGTVYIKQSLVFTGPVFIGDEITARVEVAEKLDKPGRWKLETEVHKGNGDLVITGEASVYFPQ